MKHGFDIAEPLHSRPPASRLTLSAMGSLAAHLALGAALAWNLSTTAGGGFAEYDAISIEMVDGRALDARLAKATPSLDAGSTASVAESEGATVPTDAASPESARTKVRPDQQSEQRPDPRKDAAMLHTGSLPAPPATVSDHATPPDAISKDVSEPAAAPAATASAAAGGVATQAAEASAEPVPAEAGASPGEVDRYGGAVSRALNRMLGKLAGSRRRGLVRIQFLIGEKGDVVDIQVKESSGDAALDTLASRLLRQASFPEPPARMTEAQRTYVVPVRVR